ncbi:MAG TPA: polysaccharide deacetylase family protein [Chryseolinea sp.]|nr:polysaccharide deacetylase family protein [Chryseolinea sp.]
MHANNTYLRRLLIATMLVLLLGHGSHAQQANTTISVWPNGKKGAVSLTFDDGSINQFTVALPILNRIKIPATFFIITGQIPGSQYQGKFIGRPVEQIIKETATVKTNKDNFFERASAIPFLGYAGTLEYHTNAGSIYDEGGEAKANEAYAIIDEGYRKVRAGEFKPQENGDHRSGVTWEQIKTFAAQGHEFSSHTVTHPRLAVLDEVNMLHELEKSKEEIRKQLGDRYTFSAEGPYGTENERVMQYMYKIYPALRNRMPEKFLTELNRSSKVTPGTSKKEYVQWQRGATTKTPLPMMKSWVDTVASHTNNWLVLVFHGVDGIGYEALSHEVLDPYFQYIKQHDSDLWIATFGDVAKYMRERMNATVKVNESKENISITLTHSLGEAYNLPLTLRSIVPGTWKEASIKQGSKEIKTAVVKNAKGNFVEYQAMPNQSTIVISPLTK